MSEEHSAVAEIFKSAGWTAGKGEGWDGQFIYRNTSIVGGIAPNGASVVKTVERIPPGHPQHSEDTPDTLVEAAQWLVARYANPLTTEATLDPVAFQSEQVETPQHESDGEFDASELGQDDANGEASFREGDGDSHEQGEGDFSAEPDGLGASGPIDADFEAIDQLGSEDDLLADESFAELSERAEVAQLSAPEPEDFAPDEIEHPESAQDRFIGLDDLDRVRSLRIGDVATEALRLTTMIEQAVSEQEGEFSNIQAYVVSNLDKHTGAFTPQDDTSRVTYGRFLELSSARSKTALIDARRKDATAFLIAAGRDDVVSFDVAAAFA